MGAAAAVFGSTASRALLAAIAGAGSSVALVHTWAWAASLLGLALLVALIRHVSPGRAAWIGLAFSAAWIGAATWWLYISMHDYGGLVAPIAALAVALLALAMGAYVALACAAFARGKSRRHGARDALFFALLWLLAELARARLFTGFPWGASGYTQIDGPLAALAPWIGVYGIGFVAALIAALVVLVHGGLGKRVLPLLLLVIAPLAAHDFSAPSASAALRVSLVQTNVAQNEKFDKSRLKDNLRELQATIAAAKGTLVVVPETAIPLLPQDLGPEGFAGYEAPFRDGKRGALVGLPLGDFEHGYTNSVAGFGGGPWPVSGARPPEAADAPPRGAASEASVGARVSGARPPRQAQDMPSEAADAPPPGASSEASVGARTTARYHYDKHHLVPFGEFIPFGFRWFVNLMQIPLGDFARGPLVAPSFRVAGERVAPNICYEDLFGEELAQRFGPAGDAPTIFANVSNIAWFGDTIAIDQHLNISRMRTLELQRPMIRATNTGATAVIDHTGRVTAQLPRLTKGVLDATVEGRQGVTPYAQWIAAGGGVWPLALGAGVLAALLALARRDFRAPVEGV